MGEAKLPQTSYCQGVQWQITAWTPANLWIREKCHVAMALGLEHGKVEGLWAQSSVVVPAGAESLSLAGTELLAPLPHMAPTDLSAPTPRGPG